MGGLCSVVSEQEY
uniref:Uncharacterized protein n=1 Tax=Anguilla anguilla TaxID=7936 RepID=A0A0E9VMD8_ANGAN